MAPFDYDPALGHLVATGTVMDLPAIIVTLLLTILLVIGIRESAGANNVMVGIKVVVILLVIVVGAFYINPANWRPFAPFGYTGLSFFGKTLWGQTGAGGDPWACSRGPQSYFSPTSDSSRCPPTRKRLKTPSATSRSG